MNKRSQQRISPQRIQPVPPLFISKLVESIKNKPIGTNNQEYPYQFNSQTQIPPAPKHSLQQKLMIPLQGKSGLQGSISEHANPIAGKHLFPILKPGSRPNSQDNKYQYIQNEKSNTKRRAQSLHKSGNYNQSDTATTQRQPATRSPYKPSYNHYNCPAAQDTNTYTCTCSPHNNSNSSRNMDMGVSGGIGNQFLGKCLQHVMIQNSCLTKQVAIKEMELKRLREELTRVKDRYTSFHQSKVDLESLGTIDLGDNSFSPGSSSNLLQISQKLQSPKMAKMATTPTKPVQLSMQFSQKSSSPHKYECQWQQIKQKQLTNLTQIENLIKDIEREEYKLRKNMQDSNLDSISEREIIFQDEEDADYHQIDGRRAGTAGTPGTPGTAGTPGTGKDRRTVGGFFGHGMEQGQGQMDGMEFTRLDRLRMKKGLVSRRDQGRATK